MAEIPSSWGLKKKKRSDGKLDIIGKTDAGEEYKVRTTSGPEVTDADVKEIAAVDREQTTAREFVQSTMAEQKKLQQDREDALENDFTAIAEDIVGKCTTNSHATSPLEVDLPLKCGMSTSWERGRRYWLGLLKDCSDPARRREIEAALENY